MRKLNLVSDNSNKVNFCLMLPTDGRHFFFQVRIFLRTNAILQSQMKIIIFVIKKSKLVRSGYRTGNSFDQVIALAILW